MLYKIIDDVGSTLTVDFLTAGEGEVNIVFRNKTVGDEIVCGAEHTVKGDLCVQGATPPQDAFFYDTGKGRLFPAFFVDRHYIVVGHHYTGSGL